MIVNMARPAVWMARHVPKLVFCLKRTMESSVGISVRTAVAIRVPCTASIVRVRVIAVPACERYVITGQCRDGEDTQREKKFNRSDPEEVFHRRGRNNRAHWSHFA